ncbi:MAG: L-threonylcarbamoyladenylate synthase [Gammaproteobacteria bacterium]
MSDFKLRLAARCILDGGIVAYPTEAVYGLGCDPFNGDAVHRLLTLKQRSVDKGVILIAANYAHIEPFIEPLTAKQLKFLHTTWPGPTTWLLPAQSSAPQWITGKHDQIAIRITAHPLAKALCETVGQAIVSTSANISNQPPAKTPLAIRRYFHNALDYILTGSLGNLDKPTPIKDLLTGHSIR